MSDYGAILAWGIPVRGREEKAIEVFMEAQEMYSKAQANGQIAEFETILIQPSAGGLPGGHTIAWGTEDQIDAFVRDDAYTQTSVRAGFIVEGLALSRCVRGDALMEGMGQYGENIARLT